MSLVPLDTRAEIPMDEVLVWKFPLPSVKPKPSLTTQARFALAEWLIEAARRIQPKSDKAGPPS
jgi:hypothetical protein